MLRKGTVGRIAKRVKPRANGSCELKPHKIPNDMIVIIDTREQNPLWLPKPMKDLVITRGTLTNGDYSLRGHESTFAIERKQQDIFSYLTSERDKTKVKLERLRGYEFKALVIEYSEDELYMPHFFTDISPEVIRQSLISFEIKYGLHVFYGDRKALERKVLDWMIYYWKFKRGV
uniref:ERCC4 domain-containing protein n=1 Tax=viral metagenome TaxID=1070528 RepID=A0A6H1ZH71_9ZZZZ